MEFAGQSVLVPTKRREYRNFSVPSYTRCETAETFILALTAGVNDTLGDFGKFHLSLLGYPPQHLESGDVIGFRVLCPRSGWKGR